MTDHSNRITQGQFSYLPDLTDAQITSQITYALKNGWALKIEYTDDPDPRNTYWEMFGMPMFDLGDPAGILMEINSCRKTFPNHCIRVTAFGGARGRKTLRMSFIVHQPKIAPGSAPARPETEERKDRSTVRSSVTGRPKTSLGRRARGGRA